MGLTDTYQDILKNNMDNSLLLRPDDNNHAHVVPVDLLAKLKNYIENQVKHVLFRLSHQGPINIHCFFTLNCKKSNQGSSKDELFKRFASIRNSGEVKQIRNSRQA